MSSDYYHYYDQPFVDRKVMGRRHYENKRRGKIRRKGETHRMNSIRFVPLEWPNRFLYYVYEGGGEDEIMKHQFNFFGNYFYSLNAFRALSKYYNFSNMVEIVQFLRDIHHLTEEKLKKMIRIVYLMKKNPNLMGDFCYECGTYECDFRNAPKKKKKNGEKEIGEKFL